MKIIRHTLIASAIAILAFGCKKNPLTGDNKVLIGTWTSISTVGNCGSIPGQPMNPNYKLELIEKGKYKLYQGNKKIEEGRLLFKDNIITFTEDNLETFEFNKKNSKLDGRKILNFNKDSLNIDRNECLDDYHFRFIKN